MTLQRHDESLEHVFQADALAAREQGEAGALKELRNGAVGNQDGSIDEASASRDALTEGLDAEARPKVGSDAYASTRLRDLQAIPDRVMNGIHAIAYDFYQQGRLDEAEAFFRFLCLYDFYNPDYAIGLAAVFQLQGRHRQAIDLYGVAMRLGFDDPAPVFHAGQCLLKLGEVEDARERFAHVKNVSSDDSIRGRAAAYLESIGGAPQRDDDLRASHSTNNDKETEDD